MSACRVCGVLLDDLDAAICDDCLSNGNGVVHGLRTTYQHACRCDPCTDANRRYSAQYRQAIHHGRPPLGAHVASQDAVAVVAALTAAGYTPTAIADALGTTRRGLPQFGPGVTLRTLLRLRRLQRHWMT